MIIDNMKNINTYKGINKNLDLAIDYLQSNPLPQNVGVKLNENCFCNVCKFNGNPILNTNFEAHKRYIDFQIIASGYEVFEVAQTNLTTIATPYDIQNDISFHTGAGNQFKLEAGNFVILFPQDAHKGGKGSDKISKTVFKLKVE
ncbi:MAG: YhcH/YjgK/YiaL family protein [Clostridia bacterium]